jgi:hypothetical protein
LSFARSNGTVAGDMGLAGSDQFPSQFIFFFQHDFFGVSFFESQMKEPSHNSIKHLLRGRDIADHYRRGIAAGFPFLNLRYFWAFLE